MRFSATLRAALRSPGRPGGCFLTILPLSLVHSILGFDSEKQPEGLGLGRVTKYKNSHTCGLGPQEVSEVFLQGIFWNLHGLSHGTRVWNNRSQGKAQKSF